MPQVVFEPKKFPNEFKNFLKGISDKTDKYVSSIDRFFGQGAKKKDYPGVKVSGTQIRPLKFKL